MSRYSCVIVAALLLLALAVPAIGKNYQLHSPKLWTQQEREQYERENPAEVKEQEPSGQQLDQLRKEQLKKDKEQADKQKGLLKKEQEQVEKQRELLKKDKEEAEKQKKYLKREIERTEQQKEQLKKEREHIKQQKVRLKEEKERIKKENERVKEDLIQVKDGVSYREVTVQSGDTLFDISKKYRKEGSLYSETLRFNDMKDPDHIAAGDIIKVPLFMETKGNKKNPVKQKQLKSDMIGVQKPISTLKKPSAEAVSLFTNNSTSVRMSNQSPAPVINKNKVELSSKPTELAVPSVPIFSNNSTSKQKLYEQAIRSYRSGDCRTAIQLFGQFLTEQTSSALAADASLFIADCYLRLSGK